MELGPVVLERVERELEALKNEVDTFKTETRNDIAQLRTDLAEFRAEFREFRHYVEARFQQIDDRIKGLEGWLRVTLMTVVTTWLSVLAVLITLFFKM